MKMHARLPLLPALLFLAISLNSYSQNSINSTLDSLAAKLIAANTSLPALFVHLDKPVQSAGGTLWYKVYMYQQSTQIPYSNSTTVYVDLLTDEGKRIEQQLLESTDMRLEGAFQLSRELAGGRYWLRVYTADIALKNPSQVFVMPVYISNPLQKTNVEQLENCLYSAAPITPGIMLFPEGNYLINGIDNLVAVQAFDNNGKPMQTKGVVKDNRDSTVASFQTDAFGFGKFLLAPVKARKYRVVINNQDIALPDVPINAFQLALVKEEAGSLSFRIGLSDLLYTKSPASYLVGMSKGRVCFTAAGKGMYLANVPKEKFSSGVAHFYLFDDKQQLVSERSVYIEKNDLQVTIEPDKKQYMRRATVKLSVTVADNAGKAQPALLSVSVTDNKAVSTKLAGNFPSSVMARETYNPFLSANQVTTEKNLLLLTQPFGVIGMKEVEAGKLYATPPGLVLRGRLVDEKNNPVINQSLSIFSEQEKSIIVYDTTDEKGEFSLRPLFFYDSTQFYIVADVKNKDVKNWKVELAPFTDYFLSASKSATLMCSRDTALLNGLSRFETNRADSFLVGRTKGWLQQITVKGKKGNTTSDNNLKRNSFSRMITREQLSKVNPSNTANVVKMIPGVIMVNNRLTIRGGTPSLVGGVDQNTEPLVVVDGVQASAGSVVDYLNSILPENIDYIEVLTGPEAAQYGTRSANGVIVIKTGPPGPTAKKGTENVLSFYPRGYTITPDFYQPDYTNDAVREANFNDNRSTIYWNGNLLTDDKGKVSIQFFSADPRTEYTVTIVGITSKGEIIHKQIVIPRND